MKKTLACILAALCIGFFAAGCNDGGGTIPPTVDPPAQGGGTEIRPIQPGGNYDGGDEYGE